LIGVIFIIVFYVTKNSVFAGKGKSIFKGYVNLLASFLIALLGFAMLRFMNYEKKWERKLRRAHKESVKKQQQGGKGTNWAIFLLCFSAVFREGIEAVVFLAGVSTTESVTAIPIAAVVGIICGLACGFILFFTGRQIKDLKWFFVIAFFLLFLIAAGLVSTGVSAWQSIGWWGTMFPSTMRPWWNQPVWDTCGCCSDNIQNNKFFGLVNAIFGYQCQPTFISLFSYVMFWVIVFVCMFVKWRRGGLIDAEFKAKNRENKRRAKLGLPPIQDLDELEGEEEGTTQKEASDSDSPRLSSSSSDNLSKAKLAVPLQEEDPYKVTPAGTRETELTEKIAKAV
jgi:high-affinity iron transporter